MVKGENRIDNSIRFKYSIIVLLLILGLGLFLRCDVAAATEIVVLPGGGLNTDPETEKLAETVTVNKSSELWHYSGGYWGAGSPLVYDTELNRNLTNADLLAKSLNQLLRFEFAIDPLVYADLVSEKSIKVVLTTNLYSYARNEPIIVDDLIYGFDLTSDDMARPKITLSGGKAILEFRPKMHFYKSSFNEILPEALNVNLPIVDPDYGQNVYAIWKKSSPSADWKGANGHFDINDIFALPPAGSGLVSPGLITNKSGHLLSGYNINTYAGGSLVVRKSEEASVGAGTINNGGAVGIRFNYPLKLEFYSGHFPDDIEVSEEVGQSSAAVFTEVTTGLSVKSTYASTLTNVSKEWIIQDADGHDIIATFSGDSTNANGPFSILDANDDQLVYASFIMPDSDVSIKFQVNKDGLNPIETKLDNNIYETTVIALNPVPSMGEFDLDFDILSKKVEFSLSNTPVTASLSLPRGSWHGSAWGNLDVVNGASYLFENHIVFNNPTVTESSATIGREPFIQATINRDTFLEDPIAGHYLKLTEPWKPLSDTGRFTYGGTISRDYRYYYYDNCGNNDSDPLTDCPGHRRTRTTSASFIPGTYDGTVHVYSYNGGPTIDPPYVDSYIDNNTTYDLNKELYYQTEPYNFSVIRWMYDEDALGNHINPQAVRGQYDRTFTNQGIGNLNIAIQKSQNQQYEQSRLAAKKRVQNKSSYDYAVFSTDRDKNAYPHYVDYPIKSGYYFNPTGEYTFTVETISYKRSTGKTTDHQELVDAIANSFRYESDLMYINSAKTAVDLQNQRLSASGNNYAPRTAALTLADPTGVDSKLLLRKVDATTAGESWRYEKDVEEIKSSPMTDGYTDPLFKEILEGFNESGTKSSHDYYRYREYIEGGQQKLYKITEKSTVTIQVNPLNQKVYTHARMKDGTYHIKVGFNDVNLSGMSAAYKTLGTLYGLETLDEMEIEVEGSMYDDSND